MKLTDFSLQHGLRHPRRDECGDLNIIGKRGDIYEWDAGLLAVTILRCPNAEHWNKYRKAFKAISCRITQNGDHEGTAVIDPSDDKQTRLAMEAIRIAPKRKVASRSLLNLKKPSIEGPSFPLETHFLSDMGNPSRL